MNEERAIVAASKLGFETGWLLCKEEMLEILSKHISSYEGSNKINSFDYINIACLNEIKDLKYEPERIREFTD